MTADIISLKLFPRLVKRQNSWQNSFPKQKLQDCLEEIKKEFSFLSFLGLDYFFAPVEMSFPICSQVSIYIGVEKEIPVTCSCDRCQSNT